MHWIALPLPPCAGDDGAALMPHAEAAGWWALRFTPRVVLVDGEAVLMEVSTTERLWGGRDALLAQVREAWVLAAEGALAQQGPDVKTVRGADGTQGADEAHAGNADHADHADCVHPSQHSLAWMCGCAPTALMAQAFLRVRVGMAAASVGRTASSQGRQAPPRLHNPHHLPLHTLTALRPHVASLERMGCRTWGALLALPRAGVARRFGAAVLQVLDQALGHAPQAHRWLELPEQFVLTAELPALAESADALLWSAHRCMTLLQGWLQARQQGVLALELAWRHDLRRIDGVAIPPTKALVVRTAQATQDITHLRRLLAENLARTQLAAPANQITLRLLESAVLPHHSASLLPPDGGPADASGQGEALHHLLERLSARLGADQVLAPVLLADHRPECMQQWRPAAQVLTAKSNRRADRSRSVYSDESGRPAGSDGFGGLSGPHAPDASLWPTWLLRPPRPLAMQGHRPCHHGLLRLLAGPHRFEAGWWTQAGEASTDAQSSRPDLDTGPSPGLALRDYFVAHNDVAGLVWVFRERLIRRPEDAKTTGDAGAGRVGGSAQPHRWFLHGIFG